MMESIGKVIPMSVIRRHIWIGKGSDYQRSLENSRRNEMTNSEVIATLKEKFPLFRYEDHGNHVTVFVDTSSSMGVYNGEITPGHLLNFEREHARLEARKKWNDKYPNLFFHIDAYTLQPTSLYVLRDGRDGEAISGCHFPMQEYELTHLNEQAGLALQPDMFFCTDCWKAYPRSEFGFFHFAGNYCKKCEAADPEAAERARNERYD